ncbi:Serine/Threonine-Protein Phosphatase 2A Regulatory Subunit B'' Subunit Alpha, partial [Manis pentadactyla]
MLGRWPGRLHVSDYGMTDIEADGVGSGDSHIELHVLLCGMTDIEADVVGSESDGQIELHVLRECGMTDIEADGVGSETLALRKELGSGSYVTGGVQDVGTGL